MKFKDKTTYLLLFDKPRKKTRKPEKVISIMQHMGNTHWRIENKVNAKLYYPYQPMEKVGDG